jgi:hypothetical protein
LQENVVQVECTLCLQPTPSSAALACPKCRQTACVVCLLRVMEVRRAECYAVCKRCRRTKCSFCRYEFTSPMVELLEIVYRAHVHDLPVSFVESGSAERRSALQFTVLTKRTSNDGDAYYDTFYDSTTADTESTAVTLLTSQALTQQHGFSVEISVVVDRRMLLTIAGAVCAMVLYGSLL